MKCSKRLINRLVFCLLFIYNCDKEVSDSEVVGVYICEYRGIVDVLIIDHKGKYYHQVLADDNMYFHSDRWELTKFDDKYLIELYNFKFGFEHLEPNIKNTNNVKKNESIWAVEADKNYGNGIKLTIDYDLGIFYLQSGQN